jgi:SAM-dependent methyltransferase
MDESLHRSYRLERQDTANSSDSRKHFVRRQNNGRRGEEERQRSDTLEHLDRLQRALSAPISEDPFLSEVGSELPSHRFLKNSTQAVYARQVRFLANLLGAHLSRRPEQISVLDWGCGKGHISYLLKKAGFSVVSCDRAEKRADSAFGQPTPILDDMGITVVPLSDAIALPFPDQVFDCVVSFGVLEHVTADQASLREIRRILKPHGVLFVTFLPYYLSWTQAVISAVGRSYHDRLYKRTSVHTLAANVGFEVRSMWHAQLFPKNAIPLQFDRVLEPLDRFLCRHTPLRYLATNLEIVLTADGRTY